MTARVPGNEKKALPVNKRRSARKSRTISVCNGVAGTASTKTSAGYSRTLNRNGRGLRANAETRRVFTGIADEVVYVRGKLLHWLYGQRNHANALRYALRLKRLLQRWPASRTAIIGAECRSLVAEALGDLSKAAKQRGREIRLIEELQVKWAHDFPCPYGASDLSDRLDLLATVYDSAGHTAQAIAALRRSERLCRANGLEFQGADFLSELTASTPSRRRAI